MTRFQESRTHFFVRPVCVAIATILVCLPVVSLAAPCQQMEIRKSEEYLKEQFAKSKPSIGEQAPELELKTLDGETVKLSSYRGKNIVVIKSGYT